MAISKRVIILEELGAAPLMYRYVLWADVPVARQPFYAAKQVGMISAYKDASAGDNTALQNGSVTEKVDQATFFNGTTVTQARAILTAIWTNFQAEINNSNPWVRYGTFSSITDTWTAGGVS